MCIAPSRQANQKCCGRVTASLRVICSSDFKHRLKLLKAFVDLVDVRDRYKLEVQNAREAKTADTNGTAAVFNCYSAPGRNDVNKLID